MANAKDTRSRHSEASGRGDGGKTGPAVNARSAPDIDIREQQLFRSLDLDNDGLVLRSDLDDILTRVGLRADDVRIAQSMSALDAYEEPAETSLRRNAESAIPEDRFRTAIRHNILLLERALQGRMVIPDFEDFCDEISRIYRLTLANRTGRPADYIPQLDLAGEDADRYGVALCTIDGQRYSLGDARTFYSVQSTCKPINYCLALEEHGVEMVHRHIGHEPSGVSFNELLLDKLNRPHNPLINAGAIMTASLIRLQEKQERVKQGRLTALDLRGWAGSRFEHVMSRWQALCGGEKPRASMSIYLSERTTADRNFALGHYMREKGAFPDDVDLDDVLDFYFQSCSIELNAESMAVVAATLANGGICPVSGERVFKTDTVRHCLALMSSCGMYDYSGEFAFTIGLPAKSGVSGALLIVIPNVMGMCTWSPRLDEHGNSVRGIDFCRHLVESFNFHNYDNLTGVSGKKDPRLSHIQERAAAVIEIIWAASKGDLGAIEHHCSRGAALGCADYDGRTALHLACAEGQADVVRFFIGRQQHDDAGLSLNPRDRWGGTPLDDAYLHGHTTIIEMLEHAGGIRGNDAAANSTDNLRVLSAHQADSAATNEMIWAASLGDLHAVRRLVARGTPLNVGDYDHRTPLHLAAAEGHLDVVRYFIAHKVQLNPCDRWGNTPLDDAIRHGSTAAVQLLEKEGGKRGRPEHTAAAHRAAS